MNGKHRFFIIIPARSVRHPTFIGGTTYSESAWIDNMVLPIFAAKQSCIPAYKGEHLHPVGDFILKSQVGRQL